MNELRFFLLLLLFAAGGIVCAVRGCRIAGPERERIIAEAEKIARITKTIPALRGRILDRNGTVLVWSEHYYDLYCKPEFHGKLTADEREKLENVLGKVEFDAPADSPICRHLSPGELNSMEGVIHSGVPVEIRLRIERLSVTQECVRKAAGLTEMHKGELRGISGWELAYELQLRGVAGAYSVMRDRYGNFLPKTFKVVSAPSAGRDVKLPFTLENLEKEESR